MVSPLRRLQKALQKVRFIVSFTTINKYLLRSTTSNHRPAGLLDIIPNHVPEGDGDGETASSVGDDGYFDALTPTSQSHQASPESTCVVTRTLSSTWGSINRRSVGRLPSPSLPGAIRSSSSSSMSGDGDVDRRADEFIAKFRERLRMEKQLSLELRYPSFNRSTSSELVLL